MPLLLASSMYACGSSTQNGDNGPYGAGGSSAGLGANDADCSKASDCSSGVCTAGKCVGDGDGAPTGSDCSSDDDCASGSCTKGTCEAAAGGSNGAGNAPGTGGSTHGGSSGSGSGSAPSGGSGNTTPGPQFPGSGNGFRPLTTGCGPDTATQCTGTCEQMGGDPGVSVIRPPVTLCFAGEGDSTPDDPSAVIEQVIEEKNGVGYVHIRVTFDPSFTDNTYGEGVVSGAGWPPKRGHSFNPDLSKSDHTELLLTNGKSDTVMNFKIDLVSPDTSSKCGYETLGVKGGDGSVITGSADAVLAVATSTSRNINGCGYCQNDACGSSGDCTVDSPKTDKDYTPNPGTPNWDYRVVYEAWIALDAFGDSGFGQAYITYTHSSPAKSTDTIMVEPTPCPPEWDTPYCPPSVIAEGGNCFGTPTGGGDGGAPGAGGSPGGGGSSCPPNQQTYVTTEGASICTPIPFGNPEMTPCPTGYHLDLATEGRYCLPN